jgi:hypothetical protein
MLHASKGRHGRLRPPGAAPDAPLHLIGLPSTSRDSGIIRKSLGWFAAIAGCALSVERHKERSRQAGLDFMTRLQHLWSYRPGDGSSGTRRCCLERL